MSGGTSADRAWLVGQEEGSYWGWRPIGLRSAEDGVKKIYGLATPCTRALRQSSYFRPLWMLSQLVGHTPDGGVDRVGGREVRAISFKGGEPL